MIINVVNLSS